MNNFEIRAYTKKELALLYFPTTDNPHTAVNHLMAWIRQCTALWNILQSQGYNKNDKWFKTREVKLIVEYIGEP